METFKPRYLIRAWWVLLIFIGIMFGPSMAYAAIKNSKEDVSFLREHPHFIDKCTKEE